MSRQHCDPYVITGPLSDHFKYSITRRQHTDKMKREREKCAKTKSTGNCAKGYIIIKVHTHMYINHSIYLQSSFSKLCSLNSCHSQKLKSTLRHTIFLHLNIPEIRVLLTQYQLLCNYDNLLLDTFSKIKEEPAS